MRDLIALLFCSVAVVLCANRQQTTPPLPEHAVKQLTKHDVHVYGATMQGHNVRATQELLRHKDVPVSRRLKAGVMSTLTGTTKPRQVITTHHIAMQDARREWKADKGRQLKAMHSYVQEHPGYAHADAVHDAKLWASVISKKGKFENQPRLHQSKDDLHDQLASSTRRFVDHKTYMREYNREHQNMNPNVN